MKRHALFVGVNEYKDPTIKNLNYSSEDAVEMASVFRHSLKFDRVEKLINPRYSQEIVDAVDDMTHGLGTGDLFLFFFAGHGFRVKENHVLVCATDVFLDLEDEYAGLQVGRLKKRMRGPWNRMLVLDACQNDIRATRGADCGIASRDLELIHACDEDVADSGVQIVITSCSEGEKALESSDLKHGLFTSAFLHAVTSVDGKSSGINLESLRMNVGARMNNLIERYHLSGKQTPMFTMPPNAGDIILLDGEISKPVFVVCPICGKKNKPEETFKCKRCGRDNICLWHQDKKTYLCTECSDETNQKAVHIEHKPNVENELYSILISYIPKSDTSAVMLCLQEKFGLTKKESDSLIVKKGFVRRGVSKKEAESLASALRKSKWCIVDVVPGVNSDTILDMYRNQAENGSAKAQFNLGVIYQSAKNLQEAIKWFLKAAEQGYAPAQHALVRYYTSCEKDLQKSADLLYKAAASGYAPAQYSLGLVFAKGQGGVTQDYTKAAYWFTEAAEQGYSDAIATLGMYYEGGDFGFPKDIEKATKYYTDAVKLGNKTAKERLENLNQMKIEGISEEDFESINDLAQRLKKVDGDDYGLYGFTNKPVSDVIQRLNSIKKERVCFSKGPLYMRNEKYTWDSNAMFRGFSVVKNEIYTLFVKSEE